MTILEVDLVSKLSRQFHVHQYSPERQASPETREADVFVDPADSRARALAWLALRVELRDHHVGWVRNDGTEDTSDVTSREGNTSLSSLRVVGLLTGKAVVHHFDDGLKGSKFHHGVWDLTAPERIDALVKPSKEIRKQDCQSRNRHVTHPATPSALMILLMPSIVPVANGGIVVCMRTLTASRGQRPMSAKNSADAEPAR